MGTNNLLLKVVKRKRKRVADDYPCTMGEYTAEVIGVVSKTARFRSDFTLSFSLTKNNESIIGMADYQYFPNMDDPVAKLRLAMDNMDGTHPLSDLLLPNRSMILYQCKLSARIQFQRKIKATNPFPQQF